jgi:hypothetical protein
MRGPTQRSASVRSSGIKQLTHFDTEALRAIQPRDTLDGQWIVFTAAV